jgi:hypothetical protein
VPIVASLGVIGGVLAICVVLSLAIKRKIEEPGHKKLEAPTPQP